MSCAAPGPALALDATDHWSVIGHPTGPATAAAAAAIPPQYLIKLTQLHEGSLGN